MIPSQGPVSAVVLIVLGMNLKSATPLYSPSRPFSCPSSPHPHPHLRLHAVGHHARLLLGLLGHCIWLLKVSEGVQKVAEIRQHGRLPPLVLRGLRGRVAVVRSETSGNEEGCMGHLHHAGRLQPKDAMHVRWLLQGTCQSQLHTPSCPGAGAA